MYLYQLCFYFLYLSAVQYLLGYLALSFTKHAESGLKLICVSLIGAVFAGIGYFLMGGYRIAFWGIGAVTVAVILSDTLSFRAIFVHLSVYLTAVLCFVGAAYAVILLGGEAYAPYAPISVCFAIVAAVALVRITARTTLKRNRSIYDVEAESKQGVKKAKGFYDSGNVLYHDGAPVVVVSERFSRALGAEPVDEIAVGTVGGVQNLPLIPLTCKIYYGGKKNMLYHTYAAVSKQVDGRKYDMLLHRDMGGNNEPSV